jgi:hypothetical protein
MFGHPSTVRKAVAVWKAHICQLCEAEIVSEWKRKPIEVPAEQGKGNMREEYIRKAIDDLWRCYPQGAATFHECAEEGCQKGARDTYCPEHIISHFEGDKRLLDMLNDLIKTVRRIESALLKGE